LRYASVVDEHVRVATEELARLVKCAPDRARVGHVADGMCRALSAALRANLRSDALDLGTRSRDDEDARALTRKRQRDSATDAAPAARHESRPVRKSHSVCESRRSALTKVKFTLLKPNYTRAKSLYTRVIANDIRVINNFTREIGICMRVINNCISAIVNCT